MLYLFLSIEKTIILLCKVKFSRYKRNIHFRQAKLKLADIKEIYILHCLN